LKSKENENLSAATSELLTSSATGSEQFEELLSRTQRQAFHLALRLTGNRPDAEDLVQESYIRAFRFFHRYDPNLPFASWLYRIMTNAHIDEMRRRGKLRTVSLDEPHPETGTTWDFPDAGASPERLLMTDQMEAEIQDGLNKMTAEFRIAVLLADLEGFSYEEIAEPMRTSIGTVRSRIHRGRKQLRNHLKRVRPDKYVELDQG
jgi:RNA polymerase sigma-70 factor (ECF subfamily)